MLVSFANPTNTNQNLCFWQNIQKIKSGPIDGSTSGNYIIFVSFNVTHLPSQGLRWKIKLIYSYVLKSCTHIQVTAPSAIFRLS